MIRKIHRHWFEVWGDEEAQNRILKYMMLVLAGLSVFQWIFILVLSMRKPLLIVPSLNDTHVVSTGEPAQDVTTQELSRVLENYLRTRHNWNASNIEGQTKAAAMYVAKDFREKFLLSAQEQIRLAKEKQVAQKLYPDPARVSMGERTAIVTAERILLVGGIRAAQSMTFELEFTFGDRTEQNPEGIYITSEKLVN